MLHCRLSFTRPVFVRHIQAAASPVVPKTVAEYLRKRDPTAEEVDAALKLNKSSLDSSSRLDWGQASRDTARLIMWTLNHGDRKRAVEPWVHLLETLARQTPQRGGRSPADYLRSILGRPLWQSSASAALAAWIIATNNASGKPQKSPAEEVEAASRLVLRNDLPVSFVTLNQVGGFAHSADRELADLGLKRLRSWTTNGYTSPEFIEKIRGASFDDVRKLWNEVKDAGVKNERVHAAFVRRLAETRQVSAAFTAWNQLVKDVPAEDVTAHSWSSLLRAASLAHTGALEAFSGVWKRMSDAGIEPDADCWAAQAAALQKHAPYADLLAMYKDLWAKKPEMVNIYTVNIVLNAAGEAGDWATIDSIMDETHDRLKPTAHTYNTLLLYAQRAHKAERVSKYFTEMREAGLGPDVVTYTQAVKGLLRLGRPIDSVLAEMKAEGVHPNPQFWTTVAHGLGRMGSNVDAARQIFRRLKSSGTSLGVETYGAMIDLELRHGGTDGVVSAANYLRAMRQDRLPPNVPSYNQVIRGAVETGRLDIAEALFKEMTSMAVSRLAPNKYTFMFLLSPKAEQFAMGTTSSSNDAGRFFREVLLKLSDLPNLVDYALAGRVDMIATVDPSLVPPTLRDHAASVLLSDFDSRRTRKI